MDSGFNIFITRIYALFSSVFFWVLTTVCNASVFLAAGLFYYIEGPINPQVTCFTDAVWWSFSTVTTVGYGDITPSSVAGKVLGIFLMVIGTGLFATYTALFANAMMGKDFLNVTKKVCNIEQGILTEEKELEQKVSKILIALSSLENKIDNIKERE